MRDFEVRVPASSANLGAGFDVLGLALSLHLHLRVGAGVDDNLGAGWTRDEHHLAIRTFRAAGGDGPAAARAQFAGGRGLGFSGAARVAGVFAACVEQGATEADARDAAERRASELESHGDNATASARGGLVAVTDGIAVRVPIALEPAVVVWIPDAETSTKASRTLLPETVPFGDAVFNVGHAAAFVAAMASGDIAALQGATQDRLHQERRFDRTPASRAALRALVEGGAWCAWLSGSGPSVASLCAPDDADALARALPPGGRGVVCTIDTEGVRIA
jgi:homoserine kinase